MKRKREREKEVKNLLNLEFKNLKHKFINASMIIKFYGYYYFYYYY